MELLSQLVAGIILFGFGLKQSNVFMIWTFETEKSINSNLKIINLPAQISYSFHVIDSIIAFVGIIAIIIVIHFIYSSMLLFQLNQQSHIKTQPKK